MDAEQARAGYRAVMVMIAHESQLMWDSFRAFVNINSLLIAIAGVVYLYFPDLRFLPRILSLSGIILCAGWAMHTTRSYDYYKYWYAWMRKYEEVGLGSKSHVIQVGARYARGEEVTEIEPSLRMRRLSRLFKTEWAAYLAIFSVALVHLCVIVAFRTRSQ